MPEQFLKQVATGCGAKGAEAQRRTERNGTTRPVAARASREARRHVFNNQKAIRQDETFLINSGAPGITPVPNPFYGTGTIFQFPSALRLGVKFQF